MGVDSAAAETLCVMLDRSARSGRSSAALVDVGPNRVNVVSYSSLREFVVAGAARLVSAGVTRGDVVGSWLPNSTEAVVVEFAAASLGAIVVGVNTRYRINELAHLLLRTRPKCVVLPYDFLGIDFHGLLAEALAQANMTDPSLEAPAVLVVGDGSRATSYFDVGAGATLLALGDGPSELSRVGRRDDLVNMFSTSGSTGLPKFATHDQASVVRHAQNVAAHLDMGAGDVLMCALPLCGVFGFNAAMAALAAGACCLLTPTFEPQAALRLMAEWGVTHTCGGDELYVRLMDAFEPDAVPLHRWRRGAIADFTGKAVQVVEWAEARFGARIAGVYGSSECFAFTAIRDSRLGVAERARGGGDLVDPAIEVRAVDVESGATLDHNVVGELQIRGYNVMRGYFADPAATQQAVTEDGWLRTGDLGALESKHRFRYQCRAGDALRLHGFLVEPAEIETFLARHPAVEAAHVVGVEAEQGQEAVAFVTVHTPVDEAALLEYCRESLAKFKVPKRIVTVDRFPVTTGTNGSKVRKGELRQRAAAILGTLRT